MREDETMAWVSKLLQWFLTCFTLTIYKISVSMHSIRILNFCHTFTTIYSVWVVWTKHSKPTKPHSSGRGILMKTPIFYHLLFKVYWYGSHLNRYRKGCGLILMEAFEQICIDSGSLCWVLCRFYRKKAM